MERSRSGSRCPRRRRSRSSVEHMPQKRAGREGGTIERSAADAAASNAGPSIVGCTWNAHGTRITAIRNYNGHGAARLTPAPVDASASVPQESVRRDRCGKPERAFNALRDTTGFFPVRIRAYVDTEQPAHLPDLRFDWHRSELVLHVREKVLGVGIIC